MAIRIIDAYPGKVGAATASYPEGVPRNVSAPGALDGTPWEELAYQDIQGLLQGLLAQVPAGPIVPSGTPDTVLASQYIDALKLIVQGLDITTFDNAELDTKLRAAPDGLGNMQWLLTVIEEAATSELNTNLVLTPDGLGGVAFTVIPGSGITNTAVAAANTAVADFHALTIDLVSTWLVTAVGERDIGAGQQKAASGQCLIVAGVITSQGSLFNVDQVAVAQWVPAGFVMNGTNIDWGGVAFNVFTWNDTHMQAIKVS